MHFHPFATAASALIALVLVPAPLFAQDAAAFGFQIQTLPYPGQALSATFANGDVLSFDGSSLERWSSDGSHLVTYATFVPPVFASFIQLSADESYAVVGESSNGVLSRLDLPSGALHPLTTLVYNYDLAQQAGSNWFVSAATCGFNCGNEIWSVDAQTGAAQLEATLDGPSGPVASDPAGNLYYATQSASFPAPAGSTNVLFLTAGQIAGASVLDNSDTFAIGIGFDGGSDLAYDASTGGLYLAQNDFLGGTNRIYRVGSTPASSALLVEGELYRYISNLEVFQSSGPSVLAAFQPADGSRLLYNTTDFFSSWERRVLLPKRPLLTLLGAGSTGAGSLDIALQAGLQGGFALLAAAPTSAVAGSESVLPLYGSAPLLSPFDLAQTVLLPTLLHLDALGAATTSVLHQGDLLGLLSLQALVFDATLTPAGTSGVANL